MAFNRDLICHMLRLEERKWTLHKLILLQQIQPKLAPSQYYTKTLYKAIVNSKDKLYMDLVTVPITVQSRVVGRLCDGGTIVLPGGRWGSAIFRSIVLALILP